jgi:hypothetical protein
MAGWYGDNGTSVSATDRFRAAFPKIKRPKPTVVEVDEDFDLTRGLPEHRLRDLLDYIGDDSNGEAESGKDD